jgi:ferredoxin
MRMFRLPRKFVAVLLAVWLPLFSGNALAASIAMQSINGDCHTAVAQQVLHRSQHVSASHQHMHHAQLAANQDQSPGHQEQQNSPNDIQNSSCNNCGVCQLACSGYLAAVAINVAEAQLSVQSFTLSSTQFQSVTSAPLDPPPLARV